MDTVEGTGFHPIAASIGQTHQTPFPIRGKRQTSPNIVKGKIWEIACDLFRSHTGSQILQNIIHCNAQTPDTGFASPFGRFNGDVLQIVHKYIVKIVP